MLIYQTLPNNYLDDDEMLKLTEDEIDDKKLSWKDFTYNDKTKKQLESIDIWGGSHHKGELESGSDAHLKQLKQLIRECAITDWSMGMVALTMADRFYEGNGGEFRDDTLNEKAKNDQPMKDYTENAQKIVEEYIKTNYGDVSGLKYTDDVKKRPLVPLVSKMKLQEIYQPVHKNMTNGLMIAIHDYREGKIELIDYKVNGKECTGKLKYTFGDWFGLDRKDINDYALPGFRGWYLLQHYNKFNGAHKPLNTIVEFEIPIKVTLK
ncbi:hypothetical protein AGMMS50284_7690 [Clostridia bacterium]|nr:hypothetical protein AGMMS50284_7690 [Clostridia bacterium]